MVCVDFDFIKFSKPEKYGIIQTICSSNSRKLLSLEIEQIIPVIFDQIYFPGLYK